MSARKFCVKVQKWSLCTKKKYTDFPFFLGRIDSLLASAQVGLAADGCGCLWLFGVHPSGCPPWLLHCVQSSLPGPRTASGQLHPPLLLRETTAWAYCQEAGLNAYHFFPLSVTKEHFTITLLVFTSIFLRNTHGIDQLWYTLVTLVKVLFYFHSS